MCTSEKVQMSDSYSIDISIYSSVHNQLQPVSYKRYFRCNKCFLLLVHTIHLSLSTNLVDPSPMRTIYVKHSLADANLFRGTHCISSDTFVYSREEQSELSTPEDESEITEADFQDQLQAV